ncbi:hypothetical protein K3495_g16951, partial [Podosphaera aphanis]
MKIYQSIPEPQRQRIRNHWMKCGAERNYNWKEFLVKCNEAYFDKVGAEKAERKLHSMKQGEAQIFRQFLQEWELQFEYAGGHEWPEKLKVKQLRRSISEKLLDKIDVLKLPKDNYHDWVEAVAEVASNMEMRDNFVRKNESQVTQYTTRSPVAQYNDTSSGSSLPDKSQPILPESLTDQDGDVTMGGMKIDVKQLSAFLASLNSKGKGKA